MKKASIYIFLIVVSMLFYSCAQEKKDESEILAKINDYTLTLDEFHSQLAAELEMDRDFKITKEAKKEFLEGLIRKEILIQEAKKRDLDRKEKFIRAIEHYWEST
ncbi:MAG: SurA N-terminal domain-containing protein, partial [Candidatus Aminicenantes bacterium]|nr:SurA N-terminal domain-containing protein [Candidatus Aminicenantes bacterium]